MANLLLIYKSKEPIESCIHGACELQTGEEVILKLKPKNPDWVSSIRAFLKEPATHTTEGFVYKFEFDGSVFDGLPFPDPCDFEQPRCWSCCDENKELIDTLTARVEALESA